MTKVKLNCKFYISFFHWDKTENYGIIKSKFQMKRKKIPYFSRPTKLFFVIKLILQKFHYFEISLHYNQRCKIVNRGKFLRTTKP